MFTPAYLGEAGRGGPCLRRLRRVRLTSLAWGAAVVRGRAGGTVGVGEGLGILENVKEDRLALVQNKRIRKPKTVCTSTHVVIDFE